MIKECLECKTEFDDAFGYSGKKRFGQKRIFCDKKCAWKTYDRRAGKTVDFPALVLKKCARCEESFNACVTQDGRQTHRVHNRKYCSEACKKLTSDLNKKFKSYGLTEEEFYNIIAHQENKCLVCNEPFEGIGRDALAPVVDHDHDFEGTYRGVIHGSCNKLLGFARENIEVLRGAIKYLENHEFHNS